MRTRLLILDLPAGLAPAAIPDSPILNPGRIEIDRERAGPRWLPPAPNCRYLDPERLTLYRAQADGEPEAVAAFEPLLYGTDVAARLVASHRVAVSFTGCLPAILAECLEDDTQIDLPVEKAQRALTAGEPITLTRDVLRYAVERAVEIVGKRYRYNQGLTLRRVFGTLS
jgi:hypothetical protein